MCCFLYFFVFFWVQTCKTGDRLHSDTCDTMGSVLRSVPWPSGNGTRLNSRNRELESQHRILKLLWDCTIPKKLTARESNTITTGLGSINGSRPMFKKSWLTIIQPQIDIFDSVKLHWWLKRQKVSMDGSFRNNHSKTITSLNALRL